MNAVPEKYRDAPAWAFGDSPEQADELLHLVLIGRKTATCSALGAYGPNEPLAQPGAIEIILDGRGEARAVIRITSVEIRRFDEVDAEFAAAEGEGDLSLEYWRAEHQEFFSRTDQFSPDMQLVCERFELLEVLTS